MWEGMGCRAETYQAPPRLWCQCCRSHCLFEQWPVRPWTSLDLLESAWWCGTSSPRQLHLIPGTEQRCQEPPRHLEGTPAAPESGILHSELFIFTAGLLSDPGTVQAGTSRCHQNHQGCDPPTPRLFPLGTDGMDIWKLWCYIWGDKAEENWASCSPGLFSRWVSAKPSASNQQ